ncbi:carbohydrate sulfotransferase 1-like [Amphibalanus amphitrite]|uniref:carbohydrate sulfotransferase 1-like n=1 Tax=Amphibalanus amphitrite TaxID=1232801 RepID=UPI001C90D2D2|nr:carbohydrate sulfotransferase 1-like [Amphibalanus amphitrite]
MNATRSNTEDMLSHNPRIWSACQRGPNRNACTNEAFLSAACRLLPLHVFKLVRLRLRELEPQLRAGARVVYLVRDPRATLSSRLSSVRWCRRSDECVQPARLCADIEDDLAALRELQARFPAGLRLVRYEQLATQPRRQLRDIFEFVSFRWSAEVDRIVDESTRSGTESSEPWSVLKNSAEHVDRWKERLSPKQIDYINRKCQRVIQQLGYNV